MLPGQSSVGPVHHIFPAKAWRSIGCPFLLRGRTWIGSEEGRGYQRLQERMLHPGCQPKTAAISLSAGPGSGYGRPGLGPSQSPHSRGKPPGFARPPIPIQSAHLPQQPPPPYLASLRLPFRDLHNPIPGHGNSRAVFPRRAGFLASSRRFHNIRQYSHGFQIEGRRKCFALTHTWPSVWSHRF